MTFPHSNPDRAAGQSLLGGVVWAALSQDKSSMVKGARPAVTTAGEFDGAVDVEMRSGWYRLRIEALDSEPKPAPSEEQAAIASIMQAAGASVPVKSDAGVVEAIRTAVEMMKAPGETLAEAFGPGTIPHPECERVVSGAVVSVFEHILGDCDPATCPCSPHEE